MTTEVAQIKEMGLAVNHPMPRLQAMLGDNGESIINAVQIESPGASMVLMAHYESLPFGSKPETYWCDKCVNVEGFYFTQFVIDYMSWSVMIGLRNYQDETGLVDLMNCVMEELSIHNEESVRAAIKMNLRGDFGEVIEPFGQFNRVYLTKIMTNYEKKLLKDHKRAIEIRDKLKPQTELSEQEKEDLLKIEIQKAYHLFVVDLRNDIDLISYVMYDYLDKKGMLRLDKDQKLKLMNDAKIELAMLPKNKIAIAEMETEAKDQLVVMAKRIAVKDYFNKMILEQKEQLF